MTDIIDLYNRRIERLAAARATETVVDAARRSMLTRAAALGASAVGTAAALMAPTTAAAQTVSDADVLTFALNLEYLEAQFYSLATTGNQLPASMTTGMGTANNTPGTVTGGSKVNFTTTLGAQYAAEIAYDEEQHVAFLRTALGNAGAPVIACPAIDLQSSFATLFSAAGLGANFNPFASENNFFLGSFVFEDVGVTAYKGASPLIANKTYLEVAAGILAVEAYHAGLIRTVLYARGVNAANTTAGANGTNTDLRSATNSLSAARAQADGTGTKSGASAAGKTRDDQGIGPGQDPTVTDTDTSNIVPLDANGIAFSRSTGQVLNVVYLNTDGTHASSGGFFPNGMNGTIKTSNVSPSTT